MIHSLLVKSLLPENHFTLNVATRESVVVTPLDEKLFVGGYGESMGRVLALLFSLITQANISKFSEDSAGLALFSCITELEAILDFFAFKRNFLSSDWLDVPLGQEGLFD